MQTLSGIGDNVSLAVLRVSDPGVFDHLINVFVSVARAENVIAADLPFGTDGDFRLAKRFEIGINSTAAAEKRGVRIV